MNKHQRMLLKAKEESKKSEHKTHTIGCVLTKGSKILSVGYNKVRYKSKGRKFTLYNEALHAERDTLSKVNKQELNNCILYVWRNCNDETETPALARPCSNCMKMIYELGFIKRVIYTVNYFPYYEEIRI